jgi:hypothetical protein
MPSRVRVAGLIGNKAYFGKHLINYLRNVGDSVDVLITERKKGLTWQDVLRAWELLGKFMDGNKLYVIRERRGVRSSRSLFNQKLLGYRRNKKKKMAKLLDWGIRAREEIAVNQVVDRGAQAGQLEQPVAMDAPPQELRRAVAVNQAGEIVYVND